jgi:Na+-transporting methylmalonyl-CoA/oxaloacetate decarboxylase gamma subunit
MDTPKYFGFKYTFACVGIVFMFLSFSLYAKGFMESMAIYQVPAPILTSEHYYDAIVWVYTHMFFIGVILVAMGFSVTEMEKQKWVALLITFITAVYTFLDFRTSDSALGNGLYKGEGSVFPAFISAVTCLLFLRVCILLFKGDKKAV